ncbi:Smt3-specific protease [Scheffersomyces spartinae]|uniref:Smt3-specific protease n=1 Tax=Scheffersomyces spartinae TaxID=45513 RepID=A0A9P7V7C9_9ASCO|nr:Smt3-specific protease [Scheffersomyces spartinae]KAG7192725.1 Smt3-specific protease [Scheffersomyces spartinae]
MSFIKDPLVLSPGPRNNKYVDSHTIDLYNAVSDKEDSGTVSLYQRISNKIQFLFKQRFMRNEAEEKDKVNEQVIEQGGKEKEDRDDEIVGEEADANFHPKGQSTFTEEMDADASLMILDVIETNFNHQNQTLNKYIDQIHKANQQDNTRTPDSKHKDHNDNTEQYGLSLLPSQFLKDLTSESTTYSFGQLNLDNDHRPNLFDIDVHNLTTAKSSDNEDTYKQIVLQHYIPSVPPPDRYSFVDELFKSYNQDDITAEYRRQKQDRQHKITQERISKVSQIQDLSSQALSIVNKHWSSNSSSVVVSNYLIDISARDLQTLNYGRWLNDNIIDYYFNMITKDLPSVYGWTTHFFTTLQDKGYQGVARWAKRRRIDVTLKDLILIPINIMLTHWALATVNNKLKKFQYYDSLTSRGNIPALKLIREYMIQEGQRLASNIDFMSYEMNPNLETPQQRNGFDCGVFTCTCAKFVAFNKPLTYGQKDMKTLRRRMAFEIIENKLLDK